MSPPLDPLLVELLVCPVDKQSLWFIAEEAILYNPRLRRRYPVRDGIPVLLVDESEPVDEADHVRLEALRQAGAVVETGIERS